MTFYSPWVIFFIPFLFILVYWRNRKDAIPAVRFSSIGLMKSFKPNLRIFLAKHLIYLKLLALILFVIALARPRSPLEETKIQTEGIDIILTVDCSGSMLAEDFIIDGHRQNRLAVVKKVVEGFIRGRKTDRIGVVAFAARAYTVCPLTLDYDWLIENLKRIKIGIIEDGTAVGSAVSSSLNRLKEDKKAKSKIVILLTDGLNNAGKIAPLTAAEAAKTLGIKIYTIGAGSKGLVPYPAQDLWGNVVYQNVKIDVDEDTLRKIAEVTGGKYFRATDTDSLRQIYQEIDKLEKTPEEDKGYQEYKELFPNFLIPGILVLLLEIILGNTILRRLP